jgi:hypothetical protein
MELRFILQEYLGVHLQAADLLGHSFASTELKQPKYDGREIFSERPPASYLRVSLH